MARIYGPVVINLDERVDRLSQMESEFADLGLNFIRMPASKHSNPALGCIDSHCRVLEDFLKTDDDVVLVCEDDAQFKCRLQELEVYIKEFIKSGAEVLCLGFYASNPTPYSKLFFRSNDIQNRVAYIVKREPAKELIKIWRKLYQLILSGDHITNPTNWYSTLYNRLPIINKAKDIYRGDQAWKICQQSLIFVIPEIHLVVQRESYSDIEKRVVNYGH